MDYQIVESEIMKWTASYDGQPFHCIFCDPPYHLTSITKRFGGNGSAPAQYGTDGAYQRASTGFMGKTWDGGDVAFRSETWAALAEHLYPGGFGMAFASSRGQHRMACAIEDAGLRIMPTIGWVYGCLSEDTEILTDKGWQRYDQLLVGSMVMCYNIDSDNYSFLPTEGIYVYPYNDTAYHIQSDNTDQIVSRNHHCLVERAGRIIFKEAETLECQESVPFLEDVCCLQKTIYDQRCQTKSQENLFRQMPIRDNQKTSERSEVQKIGQRMHLSSMWKIFLPDTSKLKKGRFTHLFKSLQWHFEGGRMEKAWTQGEVWMDRGESKILQQKNVWPKQSRMERRCHLSKSKRKLRELFNQICKVPRRIYQHGTQGRLCYGASTQGSSSVWTPTYSQGSSTSYRWQPREQRLKQSDVICNQQGAQAIRGQEGTQTNTTLATITPIHYEGIVWCVKVPTGAFVARRNGKIFITGNSGFPKATRIDTQVDRAAGVDIKRGAAHPAFAPRGVNYRADEFSDNNHSDGEKHTATSDKAKAWAGHRYGGQVLKPALEFIIVFQKPYSGRPIDNITETGAGAINVDGGRIPTNWEDDPTRRGWQGGNATNSESIFGNNGSERVSHPNNQGRWPANLILDDSEKVRAMFPETKSGAVKSGSPRGGKGKHLPGLSQSANRNNFEASEGSAARFFYQTNWNYEIAEALAQADPIRYCAKPGRKERDAGLDDLPLQTRNRVNAGGLENEERWAPVEARNTHPTVKPISLCKYLATLLLPPEEYAPRRILIPFAGSGSEMIGAMLAGWDEVIGIEMSVEYTPIARARLDWWADWIKDGQTDIDKILGAVEEERAQRESGQRRLF